MPPAITDRPEGTALVVRTDYGSDDAWHEVRTRLKNHPYEDTDDFLHLVDDPAWNGASADDVRTALTGDGGINAVYLADAKTMADAGLRPLLAVYVFDGEEDREELADLEESGSGFRTVPEAVYSVHGNLEIANMDFQEYASWAADSPGGVLRS